MECINTVVQLKKFYLIYGIPTIRVLAITVQLNHSTDFCSLIVNFDENTILSHYPKSDELSKYKEIKVGNYLVCYHGDHEQVALPSIQDTSQIIKWTHT